MAEASFAKELGNGRGVRLHMNFHCYLSDPIPILGFYAIENLNVLTFLTGLLDHLIGPTT